MDIIQQGILTLIKSAITGENIPLPTEFSLDEALPLIAKHRIVSLAHTGAVRCGVPLGDPAMQKLLFNSGKLMVRSEKQMRAVQDVLQAFSENEIDYMPIKGCLMKGRYPSPELRFMGDADVLIRSEQYDRIIPIMQSLSFEKDEECDHVFVWKRDDLLLELHVKLIPSSEKFLCDYFGDGWHLAKKKGGFCYAMSKEDEYIFLFSHFVKHYRDSGIGCRHVIDLWVFDRLLDENSRSYILQELKKMKLDRFYENMQRVIKNWFEDKESDSVTDHITDFIFSCGNWGTAKNHLLAREILNIETSDPEKMQKTALLKDMFPPAERIKGEYPVLDKMPFALPFVWVWRLIKTALFKRESVRRSVKRAALLDADSVNDFQNNLEAVGLEVNMKNRDN